MDPKPSSETAGSKIANKFNSFVSSVASHTRRAASLTRSKPPSGRPPVPGRKASWGGRKLSWITDATFILTGVYAEITAQGTKRRVNYGIKLDTRRAGSLTRSVPGGNVSWGILKRRVINLLTFIGPNKKNLSTAYWTYGRTEFLYYSSQSIMPKSQQITIRVDLRYLEGKKFHSELNANTFLESSYFTDGICYAAGRHRTRCTNAQWRTSDLMFALWLMGFWRKL